MNIEDVKKKFLNLYLPGKLLSSYTEYMRNDCNYTQNWHNKKIASGK
jgi:hypothetical protein